MFWTSPIVSAPSTRPTASFVTARSDQDKNHERQYLPWEKPGFRGHPSSSCEPREKIEAERKFAQPFELAGGKKNPTNVPHQLL